jgi:hypothetical protein
VVTANLASSDDDAGDSVDDDAGRDYVEVNVVVSADCLVVLCCHPWSSGNQTTSCRDEEPPGRLAV